MLVHERGWLVRMTEYRDVYLLTETKQQNPDTLDTETVITHKAKAFCKVNNLGWLSQQALFNNKIYNDAITVIVSGSSLADKIAFIGEYDTTTNKGVVYDISLKRRHGHDTAFYCFNSKAGVVHD